MTAQAPNRHLGPSTDGLEVSEYVALAPGDQRVLCFGSTGGATALALAQLSREVTVINPDEGLAAADRRAFAAASPSVRQFLELIEIGIDQPFDTLALNWYGLAIVAPGIIQGLLEPEALQTFFGRVADHLGREGCLAVHLTEAGAPAPRQVTFLCELPGEMSAETTLMHAVITDPDGTFSTYWLHLVYEMYRDGMMVGKRLQTSSRRVWDHWEVVRIAGTAGLEIAGAVPADRPRMLVFRKVR